MRTVKSFRASFSDLCGRPAILCCMFETTEKNWIKIKSSNLLQFSRNYPGKDSETVRRNPSKPSGLGRATDGILESQTQGQSSIRAFGRIEEFEKSNHKLMDQFHEAYYMTIVCNRWMSIRLDLLNNLIVLSSCIFAVLGRVLIGWVREKVSDWSSLISNFERPWPIGCWFGWPLHNLRIISYPILKFSYSAIGTSRSQYCFSRTRWNLSQCKNPNVDRFQSRTRTVGPLNPAQLDF